MIEKYSKMEIVDLKKIIEKIGIAEIDDLKEEDKIFTELMINSIEIVILICNIEEKFDIEFNEDELEFTEDLTVGELLNKINERLEVTYASVVEI